MSGHPVFHAITYCAFAVLLLTVGGNVLCRILFKISGLSAAGLPNDAVSAGRWIGAFERLIIGIGIIAHRPASSPQSAPSCRWSSERYRCKGRFSRR